MKNLEYVTLKNRGSIRFIKISYKSLYDNVYKDLYSVIKSFTRDYKQCKRVYEGLQTQL